jgi:hypothetical protein
MPVQRIVMPDGTTKAFRESATKADIMAAIEAKLAQIVGRCGCESGCPACSTDPVVVTQNEDDQKSSSGILNDLKTAVGKIDDVDVERAATKAILTAAMPGVGGLLGDVVTRPGAHNYEMHEKICDKRDPWCTRENVDAQMPNAQFPFQHRPTKANVNEDLLPGGLGAIRVTREDAPDGHPIWTNTTRDTHFLRKGTVQRHTSDDPNAVYMDTVGQGRNPTLLRSLINQVIGPMLFYNVDNDLRNRVSAAGAPPQPAMPPYLPRRPDRPW